MYESIPLTEFHRENLAKLATHLESLPVDYNHFNMGLYFYSAASVTIDRSTHDYFKDPERINICGTVACALGHGPASGVKPTETESFTWSGYSEKFIPRGEQLLRAEFYWLFCGAWERVENTHYGAAARIRYLLDHGHPPEKFTVDTFYSYEAVALYAPYRVDYQPATESTSS